MIPYSINRVNIWEFGLYEPNVHVVVADAALAKHVALIWSLSHSWQDFLFVLGDYIKLVIILPQRSDFRELWVYQSFGLLHLILTKTHQFCF